MESQDKSTGSSATTQDDYVELGREFIEIDPERHNLDELRELVSYGGLYGGGIAWEVIWQSQAVVILAEAGAGKTTELNAQTDKLVRAGKPAFFVAIEELAEGDLDKALQVGDEDRFNKWILSDEIGYFLLDSVDETRLVSKSFEVAIKTFIRRLGPAFSRCKFVVTCRFNDWQWHIDQSTVITVLPKSSPEQTIVAAVEPTDEGLLNPIFAKKEANNQITVDDDPPKPPPDYRLVALAPLDQDQWRIMTRARNVDDVEPLIQAIFDSSAEDSASRPLDLDRLIKYWQRFGELGTLSERLRYDAEQRLIELNPKYLAKHELTPARANAGTAALAAALTLCQFRSIRLPAATTDLRVRDDCLEPRSVLEDWTDPELGALLHRAMFHGTSYGCVGFHHRNMQPYFAALFLHGLNQESLSIRRLRGLLFGSIGGKLILRPSMVDVAAWLSSWEPRVRQWLISISPETLMAHGDPEGLSNADCNEVLSAFCSKYAGRTDTGLRLYREQALRLARPSMGSTIRRLWHEHAQYEDQHRLLLRMIEHGPISEVVDLAIDTALDVSKPTAAREYALQAIAAAGSDLEKRGLIDALLASVTGMDTRCAGAAVRLFYPDVMKPAELHEIVELAGPALPGVWRNELKYAIEELAKSVDKKSALNLIHAWAPLIQRKPHLRFFRSSLSERYAWLVRALAVLCRQVITIENAVIDDVTATVIEVLTSAKQHHAGSYTDDLPNLAQTISADPRLNEFFFWRSIRRESEKTGEPVTSWWAAGSHGTSWQLSETDVDWLAQRMHDAKELSDRKVAVSALVYLRSVWGASEIEKDRVFALAESAGLAKELAEAIREANKPTRFSKMDEKHRRKALSKEAKAKQSWREFRDRHKENPELLADVAQADTDAGFWDRYNFIKWLHKRAPLNESWGVRDWQLLGEGFDEVVVVAARDAIIEYWPLYVPPLDSEKKNLNEHSLKLEVGLSGLAFLASSRPDWANTLKEKDAETAIRYALQERSRFPFWAETLFAAHSKLANRLVRTQIQWDLAQIQSKHPRFSVIDTFRYGDLEMSERFMPLLMEELHRQEPGSVAALKQCLDRLMRASLITIDSLGELAIGRASDAVENGDDERACLWLSVLLSLSPASGVDLLKNWLMTRSEETRDDLFISAASALFDHDGPCYPTDRMACLTPRFVGELAKLSYTHVPIEGDRTREEAYSPDSRDSAERARNHFLERILETPGTESVRTLEELAAAVQKGARRDRLLVLADERRANNVELEALSADDFLAIRRFGELRPGNRDEFFQFVVDKSEDVRFYWEGDDDQQKSIIRNNRDEKTVQIQLKREFDRISNNLYKTFREAEVAERNSPDFIISSSNISAEVAIEVKVGDNRYTIKDFIDIIHKQLIGKYLRMPDRRAHGILLITYHGKKQYWAHPVSKGRVYFPGLIDLLRLEAQTAVTSSEHVRGVAVVGIDLTDQSSN